MGIYFQGNRAKHLFTFSAILMLVLAIASFVLLFFLLLLAPASIYQFNDRAMEMSHLYARNLQKVGLSVIVLLYGVLQFLFIAASIWLASLAFQARKRTDSFLALRIFALVYFLVLAVLCFFKQNLIFFLAALAAIVLILATYLAKKPAKMKSKHVQRLALEELYQAKDSRYDPGIKRH